RQCPASLSRRLVAALTPNCPDAYRNPIPSGVVGGARTSHRPSNESAGTSLRGRRKFLTSVVFVGCVSGSVVGPQGKSEMFGGRPGGLADALGEALDGLHELGGGGFLVVGVEYAAVDVVFENYQADCPGRGDD